jgi:HTH-type transcriptional repressor of NAD biosynthesis genes
MEEGSPRRSSGLIIGKFMPPHDGHRCLIERARACVDRLTVIVFTKASEPIPGDLRFRWMKRLHPEVEIVQLTDEHPVDYDDPSLWDLWIAAIRRACPNGPDLVFSSEPYGAELSRRLGSDHVAVDPDRSVVPVSATRIRERPFDHWDQIPPPVRAYYSLRVAIIGAESTGKTTLAKALADRYRTVWVPEFARGYLEGKGTPCEWDDMTCIAEGQAATEDALAEVANRLVFCDTTLQVTRAWSDHYFGRVPDRVVEIDRKRRYDLTLLTGLDVPWVGDGLRDCPNTRQRLHDRFLGELRQWSRPYEILSGPPEARVSQAIEAIERVLGVRPP